MAGYFAKPPKGSLLRRGGLGNGLVLAWPLNDGGGPTVRDSAGAFPGTAHGTLWSWASSVWGKAISFAASGDTTGSYVAAPNVSNKLAGLPGNSMAVAVVLPTAPLSWNQSICGLRTASSGPGTFYINALTGGSIEARYGGQTGGSITVTGTWTPGPQVLMLTVSLTGSLILYQGGRQLGSTTVTGITVSTTTGVDCGIGNTGGTPEGNDFPTFPVAGLWLWNRTLTATEAMRFAQDPWRMFRRRTLPVPLLHKIGGLLLRRRRAAA